MADARPSPKMVAGAKRRPQTKWRPARSGARPLRRPGANRSGRPFPRTAPRPRVKRSSSCRPAMAFNNNVSVAYDSLSAAGRRKKPGVSGKLYSELLRLMCQDKGAPEDIALPLLSKVTCRDHEAVPFDIFRYGVLTCLVLLEFLAKADLLFNTLGGGSGAADKRVCAAVLGTLEDALCPAEVAAPIRFLEAGSKLGPDCLASAMDKALAERKPSVVMKKEEFLQRASSIFVARVKPVE